MSASLSPDATTQRRSGSIDHALSALLLLTLLCALVPWSPLLPTAGLDASWMLALNEAVARGLAFGRDIVFTYGPYAAVFTRLYHPATDTLMLAASAWFAGSYWFCLRHVLGVGQRLRWLALIVLVAGLLSTPDAPTLSYPLLVGLAISKLGVAAQPGRADALRLALWLAPLGLLVVVKGTMLMLCAAVVLLSVLYLLAHRRPGLALLCLLVPAAVAQLLWLAAGQPADGLPLYLRAMSPIVAGYTEAMALTGKLPHLVLYALAATLLLLTLAHRRRAVPLQAAFETGLYALLLFLAFKAGFVRHDEHAVIAGTTLVTAVLLLPFELDRRLLLRLLLPALLCWGVIDHQVSKATFAQVLARLPATYVRAAEGLRERLLDPAALPARYAETLRGLRAQLPLAWPAGATDIYSSGQAYLIAAGALWSPRPVLQSYSAYTPELAQLNRAHLLGARAPQHLVFTVEPVDGRLAAQEDGASWPLLLTLYEPLRRVDEFLLLRRRGDPAPSTAALALQAGRHRLGERVVLPSSEALVQARIDLRPTLLGRLVSLLFKPPLLDITVELVGGERKTMRLVSGMARAGFMVSPLIENTAEFTRLYGPPALLAGKRVQAFSIAPRWGVHWLWRSDYEARFEAIEARAADVSNLSPQLRPVAMPPGAGEIARENCQGGIDRINNAAPAEARASAVLPLTVDGWVARLGTHAPQPDAVFVVLTDAQGGRSFLNAKSVPRPDVAAHLGQPALANSGYHGEGELAGLAGRHLVGLALQSGTRLVLCSNIQHALDIAP